MDTYRTRDNQNSFIPYPSNEFFNFESFVDPHILGNNYTIISIKGCGNLKLHLLDEILLM